MGAEGGNALGYIAVQAAHEGGRPWLLELLQQIEANYKLIKNQLPYSYRMQLSVPLKVLIWRGLIWERI